MCTLVRLVCFRRDKGLVGRVVEISGEPRHVGIRRGLLTVSDGSSELGTVDLDGVLAILITSRGATLTTPLISVASSRNIPIITCNERFQPVSVSLPLIQHNDQTRRFEAQSVAKKGLKNKLWKQIVASKVRNQSDLLSLVNASGAERLKRLAGIVRPGDLENIEAQAAQVYWTELFGKSFRRDRNQAGINSFLNYGYAVLRSSMTSAVLASGLHPTLGLFHKNKNNPLCLVDDLMEPYRPLVDQVVLRIHEKGHEDLNQEVKRALAGVVTADQVIVGSTSPLFKHMHNLSFAVSELFIGRVVSISFPTLLPELEVEALVREC